MASASASYESLPIDSPDKRDKHLVIRELLPGMVIFSQPFVSSRRIS